MTVIPPVRIEAFERYPILGRLVDFVSIVVASIVAGLYIYDSPPSSWSELGQWLWKPGLQGISTGFLALGVNGITKPAQRSK